MLMLHRSPVNPFKQVQETLPPTALHVALLEQGLGVQGSKVILHKVPVKPRGQEQVKPKVPPKSVQLPLFAHGERSHSFTSVSQNGPVYPATHWQEKDAMPSTQVAPLVQLCWKQSLMLVEQRGSVNPCVQKH